MKKETRKKISESIKKKWHGIDIVDEISPERKRTVYKCPKCDRYATNKLDCAFCKEPLIKLSEGDVL